MNHEDLRQAAAIAALLAGKEGLQGLGLRLRVVGLVRMLQWLQGKPEPGSAVAQAIAVSLLESGTHNDPVRTLIHELDTTADRGRLLDLHRRATALLQAIDLSRRAEEALAPRKTPQEAR